MPVDAKLSQQSCLESKHKPFNLSSSIQSFQSALQRPKDRTQLSYVITGNKGNDKHYDTATTGRHYAYS